MVRDATAAIASLLRGRVARGAIGTLGLRIASVGLGFLISLVLVKVLEPAGFGVYAQALAWAAVLGVPARLGFDKLLIRQIAAYQVREEWPLMKGLIRRSNQVTFLAACMLSGLGAIAALVFIEPTNTTMLWSFLIALAGLPIATLGYLRQGTLQGLRWVVTGQAPELVILPAALLIAVCGLVLFAPVDLTPPAAVAVQALAAFLAFLWGALMLRRALPPPARQAPPEYRTWEWVVGSAPFVLVAGSQTVGAQVEVLILGFIAGPTEVATYAIAARYANLILLVSLALNSSIAPALAASSAAGDMEGARRIVTRASLMGFVLSCPLALGIAALSPWLLAIFNPQLTAGSAALAALALSKLVVIATGPAAILLVMMDRDRLTAFVLVTSVLLEVVLSLVLVPGFGVNGAAGAAALAAAFWSVSLCVLAWTRLGIATHVFASFARTPYRSRR